ncbi:ribonuclease H-like domain-containing protein [Tanacetum coccineum]
MILIRRLSFDELQLKQGDLSCVHALNELHLHKIRVVPSKHEAEQYDIILTASSTPLMQHIISSLHAEFAMKNLGPLNYFLGIFAMRTTSGIFLSQKKYATEILERAQMLNCNPCRTPVDTEQKLGLEGSPITDLTLYRSLAGAL